MAFVRKANRDEVLKELVEPLNVAGRVRRKMMRPLDGPLEGGIRAALAVNVPPPGRFENHYGIRRRLLIGGLKAVEYALTHGTLAYQRRDDTVVAYDDLTGAVQWATPVDDLRDAELCEGELIDRACDTRTFSLMPSAGEYELSVAHLQEYGRAVEAFELPVETTAFGPLDQRVAGVAAAVGACGIAVVAGLAYYAPSIAAVAAGFGGPFGVVALRSAWQWSIPATP